MSRNTLVWSVLERFRRETDLAASVRKLRDLASKPRLFVGPLVAAFSLISPIPEAYAGK